VGGAIVEWSVTKGKTEGTEEIPAVLLLLPLRFVYEMSRNEN